MSIINFIIFRLLIIPYNINNSLLVNKLFEKMFLTFVSSFSESLFLKNPDS